MQNGFISLRECKRFWLRTVISWTHFWNGQPCWEWQGSTNCDGYGVVTRSVKRPVTIGAHRLSYLAYVGSIPQGFEVDHLCRNRACVNPAHLEAVTHTVNVMRGHHPTTINRAKTHCNSGHEFTNDNIIPRTNGRRECKACAIARKEAIKIGSFGADWDRRNKAIKERIASLSPEQRKLRMEPALNAIRPRWEAARLAKPIPGEKRKAFYASLTPEQRRTRMAPAIEALRLKQSKPQGARNGQ